MLQPFADDSRIWIYGFEQPLDKNSRERVNKTLQHFAGNWLTHGSPVNGSFEIIEDRFAVMVADGSPSGCSIDSSVAVFKELKQAHGLNALNLNLVFFNNGSRVESMERFDFQGLVNDGRVNDDTIVYDLSVSRLGDLRNGSWKKFFPDSWHHQAFRKSA